MFRLNCGMELLKPRGLIDSIEWDRLAEAARLIRESRQVSIMTRRKHRTFLQAWRAFRPWGEQLDLRMLLAPIMEIVTTTTENPALGTTLRDAINRIDSNLDTTSQNSIAFDIPATDPGYNSITNTCTFSPSSALPPITNPTIVDGTTQPILNGQRPLIVIDGHAVKAPADGLIVADHADGSTIRGLEIIHFSGTGGAGGSGITVVTSNNTIGGLADGQGNILGSNTGDGISILAVLDRPGVGNNLIVGNFIGTDSNGANLGNGFGIALGTLNNTVGGTTPAASNVIGFNAAGGIAIAGAKGIQNVVLGNFIGTNSSVRTWGINSASRSRSRTIRSAEHRVPPTS